MVVLSQYSDAEYALKLFDQGAAGQGYLLKERVSDIDQLVGAIREVARGGSVVDPKIVEVLIAARERRAESQLRSLTPREREVLGAIAQGKNNAAIAADLFVTERAVERHINTIFSSSDYRRSMTCTNASRRPSSTSRTVAARRGVVIGAPLAVADRLPCWPTRARRRRQHLEHIVLPCRTTDMPAPSLRPRRPPSLQLEVRCGAQGLGPLSPSASKRFVGSARRATAPTTIGTRRRARSASQAATFVAACLIEAIVILGFVVVSLGIGAEAQPGSARIDLRHRRRPRRHHRGSAAGIGGDRLRRRGYVLVGGTWRMKAGHRVLGSDLQRPWLVANFLAFGVGGALAGWALRFLEQPYYESGVSAIEAAYIQASSLGVSAAIFGALVGTAQWLVLRRTLPAGWWAPATCLGWGLGESSWASTPVDRCRPSARTPGQFPRSSLLL